MKVNSNLPRAARRSRRVPRGRRYRSRRRP
jgi:hypothetical protein